MTSKKNIFSAIYIGFLLLVIIGCSQNIIEGNILPVAKTTYTLKVDTVTGGTVSISPEQATYQKDEYVKITAAPQAGYSFTGWSGTQTSTINPLVIPMSKNELIEPVFTKIIVNAYTIKADSAAGGSVAVSPAQETYLKDDYVKITAVPQTGFVFTGWTGTQTSTLNPLVLTVSKNEWIVPIFTATAPTPEYTIKVGTTSGGVGTLLPAQATYLKNDYVQITAIPQTGYTFSGWTGTVTSTTNPLIISVSKNEWLIPVFTAMAAPPATPSFTIQVDVSAGGSTSINPSHATYGKDDYVKITAVPQSGFVFSGWTGTVTSTANPLLLTVSKNEWIIPVFTAIAEVQEYKIKIDSVSGGTTSTNPAQSSFLKNDYVQITAVPQPGFSFSGWTGTLTSTANPLLLTVSKDEWLIPVFTAIAATPEYTIKINAPTGGTVSQAPSKTTYLKNDYVLITAVPLAGYTFSGWTGTVSSTTNPLIITVTKDEWLIPVFTAIAAPPVTPSYIVQIDTSAGGTASANPVQSTYAKDDYIKITAAPQPGFAFSGWTGTVTSTANPLLLTVSKNEWLIPVFTAVTPISEYKIKVDSVSGGLTSTNPEQLSYLKNDYVQITAIPQPGYTFSGWTGTVTSTTNPLILTVSKNEWLIPVFTANTVTPEYTIKINDPAGGTVSQAPSKTTYLKNDYVLITAIPLAGYTFSGWSGTVSSTTNPLIITVSKDEWLIPVFTAIAAPPVTPSYTVQIDTSAGGTTSADPAQATYAKDDYVKITASPHSGFAFSGWTGTVTSTANPLLLTVSKNEWLIPVFTAVAATPEYTIKINDPIGGRVSQAPSKTTYLKNDYVLITAVPLAGYTFSGWSGTVSSTTNPLIITVTKDEWLIPVFTAIAAPPVTPSYTVQIDTSAGGTTSADPDQVSYAKDDFVKITASPHPGFAFSGWTGTVTSTANPLLLTVSKNEWLIPVFTANTVTPEYTIKINDPTGGTVSQSPSKTTYLKNDYVLITAIPQPGYTFSGWTGTVTSTTNPLIITVSKDEWLIPVFTAVAAPPVTPSYTVQIDTSAAGTTSVNPVQSTYAKDDYIKITAIPDPGFTFSGWTGTVTSTSNPLLLTVSKNEWLIPVFTAVAAPPVTPTYTVKIDTVIGGNATIFPEQTTYLYGTNVKITANPEQGYSFSGWTGTMTSSQNPILVSVSANCWLIPQFTKIQTYSLSTDYSPVGGKVTSSSGTVTSFTYGQKCTLHAEPSAGYQFDGWEGDITGTGKDVYITFNKDYQVFAKFSKIPETKTWTLDTTGSFNGTITRVPDKPVYFDGETVRLTANPSAGYMFKNWAVPYDSRAQTFDVTMSANTTITSTFMERKWTFIVYMAADNDLEEAAINDFNEMESYDSSGVPVSILVLLDRAPGYDGTNDDWTDTRLFEITKDDTPSTINSKRIACPLLGLTTTREDELNMAQPLNLSHLIAFAQSTYKAENYGLIIWGHGTGWRSSNSSSDTSIQPLKAICIDDSSGSNTYMPISEANGAIKDKGLKIIAFDTCFASLLEVAYEFRTNNSCWLIGSEGATSSYGWDYTSLFNGFGKEPNLTAETFYLQAIKQFQNYYSTRENATISVIDLTKVDALKTSFDAFGTAVASKIISGATQTEVRDILLKNCELYQSTGIGIRDVYIDISSMQAQLSKYTPSATAESLKNAIDVAVPAGWSKIESGRKRIGVNLVAFSGANTPEVPHEIGYIKGSGASDQSEFVKNSTGWVPNSVLSSSSLLDMVFYKTF